MNATDNLEDLIGPVAYREYENAQDWAKPKLRAWAEALQAMSDADFLAEAGSAILGSAVAMRFSGNFEHEHCKASAAYHEAKRRHVAAGHLWDCHGDTIYSRAHANAMRSQGHTPRDPSPCDCGHGDS